MATGKILVHDRGLGAPAPGMVHTRAKELAKIAGRSRATAADWARAKAELHGGHEEIDGEEGREALEASRDWGVGTMGHQTAKITGDGGLSIGEELVAEGMDEALHEQMIEACDAAAAAADDEREPGR